MSLPLNPKPKIPYNITKKELQLIIFMRNKFRFGMVELVIHSGQPQKVIEKEPTTVFDGNIDEDITLDTN